MTISNAIDFKDKTLNHGALLPINNDNNLYFTFLNKSAMPSTFIFNIKRNKIKNRFYMFKTLFILLFFAFWERN